MKKTGSALSTVLIITAALLIICTAVVTASVNTTKFNAKYSSNIDLELVAKSALNIGREDLINKISCAKETNDRNNLPGEYRVESNIINLLENEQNVIIRVDISKIEETLNNSIKYVYTITANVDKGKKIETQSIIVNITLNSKNDVDDFIENMKYNVNVAGMLTSHNSNDKHNILSGNVGYK